MCPEQTIERNVQAHGRNLMGISAVVMTLVAAYVLVRGRALAGAGTDGRGIPAGPLRPCDLQSDRARQRDEGGTRGHGGAEASDNAKSIVQYPHLPRIKP